MPSFDTPGPISVALDLAVGSASIIAGERTDTVVEVRPSDESRAADVKAAAQTLVEYSGGTLRVTAPKSWRHYTFLGGRESIEVTIQLPAGSNVQGDSWMGDFRAEGELGACRLKTGLGKILLERTGRLHANIDLGDVTVDHIGGDADVATGSGKVRIRQIEGAAQVKNGNGETDIGEVRGDVRVKAANGDISVARALAGVSAKTANGNVRIGEVVRGSVVLETAAGDLEVGIRSGTAAWLDVSSQLGSVINSLDPSNGPAQSEVSVEVRARTPLGDIVIARAA